jgi:predicted transcriptional regulator
MKNKSLETAKILSIKKGGGMTQSDIQTIASLSEKELSEALKDNPENDS